MLIAYVGGPWAGAKLSVDAISREDIVRMPYCSRRKMFGLAEYKRSETRKNGTVVYRYVKPEKKTAHV